MNVDGAIDRRSAALLLCGLAIVMLLVGAMSHAWWRMSEDRFSRGIGLTGYKSCMADDPCKTTPFEEAPLQAHAAWVAVGAMTFYGTFVGVMALVVALGLEVARKTIKGPVSPARMSMALSGALIALAIIFLSMFPEKLAGGVSYGFFVYLLGATAGVAGSLILSKPDRLGMPMVFQRSAAPVPGVQPATDTSSTPVPGPPCAKCHRAARWIQQYERYYCDACQTYAS